MALKKEPAAKRQVWNKGLEVGKRDAFTPAQVKRVWGLLADRGVPGLRDLALFSMAIDTMLQGQDLLKLIAGDVQRRNGSIRSLIEVARARGTPPIQCALSKVTANALEKWITASDKKHTDYLFPGRDAEGRHPMSVRQLSRLVKLWVVKAGLDPADYGVESDASATPSTAAELVRRRERHFQIRILPPQPASSVSASRFPDVG